MASNAINEGSFRKEDQIEGYTTVDAATAITWELEGDTTLTYTDVIVSTVFFLETGSSNGFDYSITLEGVEIASGAVAAGAKSAVKLSGYIGNDLQVLLNSTTPSNAATATVYFRGK